MAPDAQFGEHQITVHAHFECTARRFDHADLYVGVLLPQLGRQTGGPGLVVSDDAVLNSDDHHPS